MKSQNSIVSVLLISFFCLQLLYWVQPSLMSPLTPLVPAAAAVIIGIIALSSSKQTS